MPDIEKCQNSQKEGNIKHSETRGPEYNTTNGNRQTFEGKCGIRAAATVEISLKKKKKTNTRIPYASEFIG